MSSYDREILKPLKVIKVLFILYCLINLFLPTYAGYTLGYKGLYSYLSIIFVGVGVMGMHGYFNQVIPLPLILGVRVIQFLLRYLLKNDNQINIYIFIVLCLADVAICAYLFIDRFNYEYVERRD